MDPILHTGAATANVVEVLAMLVWTVAQIFVTTIFVQTLVTYKVRIVLVALVPLVQ